MKIKIKKPFKVAFLINRLKKLRGEQGGMPRKVVHLSPLF
jgi:hypothetical protein